MRRKRMILPVLLLLVVAAAALAFRGQLAAWVSSARSAASGLGSKQAGAASGPLVASGSIEAHTVAVSAQAAGRLAEVRVAESDRVAAGDLIATLDSTLLDAQVAQAQAAVSQAQAQVALLKAGVRPAAVDVARAALRQARAVRDAAGAAAADAQALVAAPGDLDVKIAGASAAVDAARFQLKAAQANAAGADLAEALWARTVQRLQHAPPSRRDPAQLQWNQAAQQQWQAHSQAGVAAAELAAAQRTLADLRAQKADPQALQAQANAAAAAACVAAAGVQAAQADLDLALSGAPPEQIQAAEALARQAESALQAAQARAAQARITAPSAGVVTQVVQHPGEVVAAGTPIVSLADLSQVELSVYVAEPDLGRVQLGQIVQVSVDSFVGRRFPGSVTHIADQAEFTPKNVETQQQRASTVFQVKVSLANPDGSLKAGMPADATFCAAGAADCGTGSQLAGPSPPAATQAGPIKASGTINAVEIDIAAELGGQVVQVAAEAAQVAAGQVVARLHSSDLEPTYRQALDAVDAAKADLARVSAAPEAARVAQAQASVAQAQAALAAAQSALDDARTQRDKPQALDSQIAAARSQAQTAAAQVELARANLKAAQVLQQSVLAGSGSDQDKTRRAIYDQQVAAAGRSVQAAQAQARGAQAVLAQLLAIRENPVALAAAVHRAEGQVDQAQAALATAHAALAQVQAPPQPEAVALAQAKVAQAQASAALLQATLDRLQVRSPIVGTVTRQMLHAGEVARPGVALLSVVDLRQVTLTIYVPEGQMGRVALGQAAAVTVDSYPAREFGGRVTHINDQAEFTPKNIQTHEERVNLVFAVEIALDNSAGLLRPGMPADAVLK